MQEDDVKGRVLTAVELVAQRDLYLLKVDISERCIASRLAMYLQEQFADYHVDIEYNRDGNTPKKLGLPEECANYRDHEGRAFVVPDVIVHRRGPKGPNVLVLELKKTTNPMPRDCDFARVVALKEQLGYSFGGLIECETREGHESKISLSAWI